MRALLLSLLLINPAFGVIEYATLHVEQTETTATDYRAVVHFTDTPRVHVMLLCHRRDKECHALMAGEVYSSIKLAPETYSIYRGDETATYTVTASVETH